LRILQWEAAMARSRIDRRKFLAGVAFAGAASASPEGARAAPPPLVEKVSRPSALRPSAAVAAAETGAPQVSAKPAGMPGSDFMVDVIKSLKIEHI
jgi:acetolactate synthase I/II/III large subunit